MTTDSTTTNSQSQRLTEPLQHRLLTSSGTQHQTRLPLTPTQVGTYKLKFDFPGQNINDYPHSPTSQYVNDTYIPSSAETTVTVQNEPIPEYPSSYPLPQHTGHAQYTVRTPGWWSISSNWLGSGAPGYGASTGPNQRNFPGDAVDLKPPTLCGLNKFSPEESLEETILNSGKHIL